MSDKAAAVYNGDVPTAILAGIRAFQASRPRSLQKEVGPSQLGNPCDHCLAAALAGWEKQNDDAWLPLIGTAVHELLLTPMVFHAGEWITEQRVTVGSIGKGIHISGNADLFHPRSGTVVDLKIVGASTLNEARRHGSKLGYQRQVQLYGKGFANQGYAVNTVIIAYLPRNSPNLADAFFDIHPYNEGMAIKTLQRAESLAAACDQFEHISTRARDVYIDSLSRSPGCFDCARYPSIVERPSELAMFATTHQEDNDG